VYCQLPGLDRSLNCDFVTPDQGRKLFGGQHWLRVLTIHQRDSGYSPDRSPTLACRNGMIPTTDVDVQRIAQLFTEASSSTKSFFPQ
jgi:hypothetical protein